VRPFAGTFAGPTGATRLDSLAERLLLFVGLAAVILGVGLLFHQLRERPDARRRRRFKRLVTRVAHLHVAVLTTREHEEQKRPVSRLTGSGRQSGR
jgi:tartrate dehydratase beta subunit/fumarate hydratase class I family protein